MSISSLPSVLLTDPAAGKLQSLLQDRLPRLTVRTLRADQRLKSDCEVWLGAPDSIIPLLKSGLTPRWIQLTWAGVTPMLAQDVPKGYLLTRATNVFGPAMLEYVLHFMLAKAWQHANYEYAQSRFSWHPSSVGLLNGKTVLIVGLGAIGSHIATGLTSLGMKVKGIRRSSSADSSCDELGGFDKLLSFASQSDYVVNVLPDTPATRDIFDKHFFSALPSHAFFINIGRGSAVVDHDLIDALESDRLAGAALDVFRKEPLPQSHQFWVTKNLWLTPHIAGPTDEGAMIDLFLLNLRKYQQGQRLLGLVDSSAGY